VLEQPLYTLAEATPIIQSHLAGSPTAKVALLFGSEKTGLSNEELSHCHALLTIPMNSRTAARHLSMNLGQAAAVCLYTIAQAPADVGLGSREGVHQGLKPMDSARLCGTTEVVPLTPSGVYTKPTPSREPATGSEPRSSKGAAQEPATSAEKERLTTLLLEVLAKSDYSRRHPANSREPVIRRLVRRMANSTSDAAVWAGILRQLLHMLPNSHTPEP
jgi:tRNA/rRNA methyltransferase